MSQMFDPTIMMLSRGLDVSLERQNALNGNVANLDTPGYVPRDVDFTAELERAMSADHAGAQAHEIGIIERPDKPASADGNAVDLDMQMARIAQNTTFYGAQTRAITRKLAMLRYAASEGGM